VKAQGVYTGTLDMLSKLLIGGRIAILCSLIIFSSLFPILIRLSGFRVWNMNCNELFLILLASEICVQGHDNDDRLFRKAYEMYLASYDLAVGFI